MALWPQLATQSYWEENVQPSLPFFKRRPYSDGVCRSEAASLILNEPYLPQGQNSLDCWCTDQRRTTCQENT